MMNILHWRLTKFDKKNWSSSPRLAYACIPPAYSSRLFNSRQDDIQFVYAWCSYGIIERRSNMTTIITTGRGKKGRWRNFSGSVADWCHGALFPFRASSSSAYCTIRTLLFKYQFGNYKHSSKTHPHELIWLFSIYCLRHERLLCDARGTGARTINYVYCHGTKALSQSLTDYYNDSSVCQFKPVLFNIKLGVPYVYAFYAGNQNAST